MAQLHQIPTKELQELVDTQIVEIRGLSGALLGPTGAASAARHLAPIVRIHSMSGDVYDIVGYIPELDTFNVELVR